MATTTPNLGLKKPNVTDRVNVSDLNGNADLLDAIIGRLSNLNTTQKDSLVVAINEALTSAGTAAGFGDPVATVDGNTGTPSVEVTASGPDTAKVFTFTFKNLKGAKGDPGAAGEDGTRWWTYAYLVSNMSGNLLINKRYLPAAVVGDYVLGTKNDSGVVYTITGETESGDSWVVNRECILKGAAGTDGTTPHIGANGNWYIGSTDTGKPSKGADGSSIQSIERTSGTGAPGTTDTYTVTLTNGDTTTFQVYNGKDGSGSGDMTKAVYDPKGKAQDIFSYADTKYSKPSGGIPKKDLASDVQASLGKADSALQNAPVTSVNSKTGAVSLTKGDVGLGNVDNVKQYSASNPPPYPVTSVNGKTGAVTVSVPTIPSTTSLIKGNGSGGLAAATRGSDYIASGNIVKQTLVATETTPTENYAINWVYG